MVYTVATPLKPLAMSDSEKALLQHYNLTEESCSRPVSDVHLEEISRSHCRDWKRLPPYLGMATIMADDIDHMPVAESEKRHQFFKTWKREKGSGATYRALIRALLIIKARQDAESICKILLQSEILPITPTQLSKY